MNIDTNSKVNTIQNTKTSSTKTQKNSETGFADKLANMSSQVKNEDKKNVDNAEQDPSTTKDGTEKEQKIDENIDTPNKVPTEDKPEEIDDVIDGLTNIVMEINNKLEQIENPTENIESKNNNFQDNVLNKVNINPETNTINNQKETDFHLNQKQNLLYQETKKTQETIKINDDILKENQNPTNNQENSEPEIAKTKTVTNSNGIKKVDTKTNITIDTITNFDEIAMTKDDVDFFAKLVENNGNNLNAKEIANSSQVSKTLADMLVKSMNENKPIRINFDNDISVIIKISRDGKISADFLPSSQIAEAYLKENLPLLRQRFDDNNINYDELNHREQKQNDRNDNRKKGRKDE